jgi:alkylation response protein AidB-like acyl-CoA dehydrogenase
MTEPTDFVSIVQELGPSFAAKAAEHDADDSFVSANYKALNERGIFAAGIPAELGGGGASHAQLCAVIRELAHYCSSTALAASMHTHPIAFMAYTWRSGNKGPEPMLRKFAAERLIVATSGGSDWLAGSGTLTKVEGGFKMNGRKIFSSGVPAANLLLTTGVYADPTNGPTVIHFPVPLDAPGVTVLDTWRVLGMRGTGSHDVQLKDVFIPDAATQGVRRPAGKWHAAVHGVALIALPVVYSAYLGVAEAARELALTAAKKRKDDPGTALLVAEMESQLVTAQVVHADMVELARTAKPGADTSAAQLTRRGIVGDAIVRTVEKALEIAGGGGFYRSGTLERLFRDAQAARYHPLPDKPRQRVVGRVLLGLDIDG